MPSIQIRQEKIQERVKKANENYQPNSKATNFFLFLFLAFIIAFATIYLMGAITGKTIAESVEFSTAFRYIYLLVVETVFIFFLWLILRIRKKTLTLNNPYDVFAFII